MPTKKSDVKQKTAKKSAPKKSAPKRIAKKKKELVSASPEQCFWIWNGPILSNLSELQEALEKDISDIQFEYHCSNGKYDFALWVNDVLCDAKCAKALAKAKSRAEAAKAVKKCLKQYA